MQAFRKLLVNFLLLWLLIGCGLAFYWPQVQGYFVGLLPSHQKSIEAFMPFNVGNFPMQVMIAVTMLAIGSLLPIEEVKMVFRRWPKIVSGTAIQYISMPLLAYLMACLFHLEGPWFFGIMIVGCVPGAMASNMLTMISRGNVSYSVGLTTSSTLFSPIFVPLLLAFFLSASVELDVMEMGMTLVFTVVAPVALGFTLSRISHLWQKLADMTGEIIANLVIIWIISSVVAGNRDTLSQIPHILLVALILVNIGGYLSGWFGGLMIGIDNRMRRALTLEIGMQNAGLGTFLAKKYCDDPSAALCCAMYTFGCMFTGILLAQLFRYMSSGDGCSNDRESGNIEPAIAKGDVSKAS